MPIHFPGDVYDAGVMQRKLPDFESSWKVQTLGKSVQPPVAATASCLDNEVNVGHQVWSDLCIDLLGDKIKTRDSTSWVLLLLVLRRSAWIQEEDEG